MTENKARFSFHHLENVIQSFLVLNACGWFIYFTLTYINFFLFKETFKYDISRLLIISTVGFLVTLVLRYIYYRVNYNRLSIIALTLYIIFSSFITANVWFFISRTAYFSLFGRGTTWISRLTTDIYQYAVFWDTILLVGWSSLYFSLKFWLEWNRQKEQTDIANRLAQTAQLNTLRYQLNPHFLFNSLNSIRALITEDKATAKLMVTELSEFLRYSLISKNYPEVSLAQEIQAIKRYFAIEKRRYEDKLEIEYDIDPLAEDYPIISFVVHPIAENAIKYGMKTSQMPLKILIKVKVLSDGLSVIIRNSGNWSPEPQKQEPGDIIAKGTGLLNVKRRLAEAYPDRHLFQIDKKQDHVSVKFEIKKDGNTYE